jgi:preprotein translocase subunit SecA
MLKANIHAEEPAPMPERPVRTEPKPVLKESRQPEPALSASGPGMDDEMLNMPKAQPVRSERIANRNDRVSVRYFNGEVKRDVKFKTVEEDILANRCVIVDM